MEAKTTTTAVTVWNAETEKQVADLITRGLSVPKALAKIAPQGHLKSLRDKRRNSLIDQTSAILSQIASSGAKVTGMGAPKELKNGNTKYMIELTKFAPRPEDALKATIAEQNKVIEGLRAQLNKLGL